MSSPKRKGRRRQSKLTPLLPDDLLLSCFARVSRLYYPTLSLVSKHLRSLIASPELYKTRSLLGNTENCLYVCLLTYGSYRWYTLCRKPDQTLTNVSSKKKKSSGYVLALVPVPHSPPTKFPSQVVVGYCIYNIDESSVSILDCRSHTWRKAPSLPVELWSVSASVLDQKIYVAGKSYGGGGFLKNTVEVFDTKTQTWDPEPIPCNEGKWNFSNPRSVTIDGKFHMESNKEVVAYNSKKSRWDLVERGMGDFERRMSDFMVADTYCVIENVLYSAYKGVFRWYDTNVRMWRHLMGLNGLPVITSNARVRLADYGGKMAVLWKGGERADFGSPGGYEKKIWCAEVVLERQTDEIWGNVEWCSHVLTISRLCHLCDLVKVLAATV